MYQFGSQDYEKQEKNDRLSENSCEQDISRTVRPRDLKFEINSTIRLNYIRGTFGSNQSIHSSVRPCRNKFLISRYLQNGEV